MVEKPSSGEKIPFKSKISWGAGGMADNYLLNVPNQLAMPIYNIGFGVSGILIGIALAIPRILDAFFDLMIGNWSDNTRTRWGRRKPWMIAGITLCSILLPLLWMPPFESTNGKFIYFLSLSILYFFAYSLFVVPFTALGYELTTDYNERTRVLAWRMYLGLIGSLTVPWVYKICFNPIFGKNEIEGVRWVTLIVSGVIVVTGLLSVLFCKEKSKGAHQEKISLKTALKLTMKNKAFLMICGGYVLILLGLFSAGTLSLFVFIYSVCHENKELAAELVGWCGSSTAVASYISLPLATWISIKTGKKEAMIISLSIAFLGIVSMIFLLTPTILYWTIPLFGFKAQVPYLQMIPYAVFGVGMQGAWLMISSMIADVCDEDELITGLRQEGIYGAVNSFAQKAALGGSAILGGLMLQWSGYVEGVPATEEIAANLKNIFISGQGLGIATAIALFAFYPITRERALETRRLLNLKS